MAIRLPRFLRTVQLVENGGRPTQTFHQWWDTTAKAIESQVTDLLDLISRLNTTESDIAALEDVELGAGNGLTGGGGILTSPSFNVGAGTGIEVGADSVGLADTDVTPGDYGSATNVAGFTVDQQGRLIAAEDIAIAIPASQLTDYETGTWTPVLSFTTPPTTPFTMDVVQATYTKIGRVVHVQAFIRTDNVNTAGAAGFLCITGLPFSALGYSPVSVSSVSGWVTHPEGGYVDSGTSQILLVSRSAANGATSLMGTGTITTGAVADQNSLMLSAVYHT